MKKIVIWNLIFGLLYYDNSNIRAYVVTLWIKFTFLRGKKQGITNLGLSSKTFKYFRMLGWNISIDVGNAYVKVIDGKRFSFVDMTLYNRRPNYVRVQSKNADHSVEKKILIMETRIV